jgi:DtxR family Mn-dependent transcriptional regulator
MRQAVSLSEQDYLKNIYELTSGGEPASTSHLASRMGISPASVTGMLQKLSSASPPLVRYRKHRGALLTPAGHRAALRVIRHHRLVEAWLVQSLGYSIEDVHREAEKLEHVISPDMEERISTALGNPMRDPHGEPIPSDALEMPADPSVPLSTLGKGERAAVIRLHPQNPAFLRQLRVWGLVPGAHLRVVTASPIDGAMEVQVRGRSNPIVIGPDIAERIFIQHTKN